MLPPSNSRWAGALCALGWLLAGQSPDAAAQPKATPALKDVFAAAFRVGAALNSRQFSGADEKGGALVKAQYNTISPENVLKWEIVHPEVARFDFTQSDRYVAFGEANGMFVIGHTLVWHSQ